MRLRAGGPIQELLALQEEVNRIFADALRRRVRGPTGPADAEWAPPVDVTERADCFVLRLDLPGVRPEAVALDARDDVLTVSGAVERPWDADLARVIRSERRDGRFRRVIWLPPTADARQVTATLRDGVVEITVAKAAPVGRRRIPVVSV